MEPAPEYIWNNRFIKINKKVVNDGYHSWRDHGISRICDIYDEKGNILTMNVAKVQTIKPSQMDYNSLIGAIPHSLKEVKLVGINKTIGKLVICNETYEINNLKSRIVHDNLISRINKHPTAEYKWCEEFPFLVNINFKFIYMLPFQIVRDTKIQVFQSKIVNRILACKETLKRWSITEDAFCGTCGETETIEHLFYHCRGAHTFIKMLEMWLNTVFNLHLHLTSTDVLFGKYFDTTDDMFAMVNYVILYAKWYMHRYKDRFFLDCLVDLKYNVVIKKIH